MPVDTCHPDYYKIAPRWKLLDAIIDNCAKDYIRTPDINDPMRSKQYKEDAILTNFTSLTKTGLTGLVFKKDPQVNLPEEMGYIEDNATGSGVNLLQLSQKVVGDLLDKGRAGLLVDYYPDGSKAYIKHYSAESIINWKTENISGECVPSLITLLEWVPEDEDDMFCQEFVKQYRVLVLLPNDIDYQYEQWVYNEQLEQIETIVPTNYDNQVFNRIPFVFLGSENNDWEIDQIPLYDLAIINLGHYRNSADYEESIFICGQPYVHLDLGDNANKDDFDAANPGGIAYGSRRGLVTQGHGSVTLVQANPNQLVAQAMKDKLEQAAAIGARLISPAGGRETAEAARIRYGSQHSALYVTASNAEDGIEYALELACQFMGADPEAVEFELNDQYYDDSADANLLAQQIMLLDRGVISKDEILDYGRKTGFISDIKSNEEIAQGVDINLDPLMGANSDNAQGRTPTAPAATDAPSEDAS